MSQEAEHILEDWRTDAGFHSVGARLFFVVPVSEAELDEVIGPERAAERKLAVEEELRNLSETDDVYIAPLDVGIGASWEAVGALLGYTSSVVTLAMAAEFYAPRIRKIAKRLGEKFGCAECSPSIGLSPEVLQVLVVDEIRRRFGLDTQGVRSVSCTTHAAPAMERRIEMEQTYACHNIMVEAIRDSFLHVWSYIVTSDGYVVTDSLTKVPIPNGSHWSCIEPRGRKLIP